MTTTQEYYDFKNEHGEYKQLGLMSTLRGLLVKFEEARTNTVIRNFPDRVDKYLDVGCNDGSLIIVLKEKYKHAIGIDISPNILKKARRAAKNIGISGRAKFQKVDIENRLPFKDAHFDAATVIAVAEHVFDPVFLLKEIHRVLKRNGLMLIEVPNVAWFPHRIGLLFGKRPRTSYDPGWEGGHLQYFTYSDLEKLLKNIGFKVIKRDCGGVFHNLRKLYLPFLSADIFIVSKK